MWTGALVRRGILRRPHGQRRTKFTVQRRMARARFAINPLPTYATQYIFSSGAAVTMRTTLRASQLRDPFFRLVKDTYAHPLWNPGKRSSALEDESGQLRRFEAKFGKNPEPKPERAQETQTESDDSSSSSSSSKEKSGADSFYGEVMRGLEGLDVSDHGTRVKRSKK
jgi:hypothetical protein